MELNNSAEMNEPPLLAIGRQSYDLASAESDCQASGSAWSPMDCNGGSVSSKNEIWHADWRPFSGDLSHTQSLQAQHRAKRQHCWSATFSSNQEEQGPGPSSSHLVCDGGSMQSLHTELFGCNETNNTGNTGFDFLQTGLNLASSSSSALPSHSLMLVNNSRQASASGTGHWSAGAGSGADLGSLFTDGDWKITRDLMSTSMEQSTESMKGKSLEHLHSNAGGGGVEVGGSHGSSSFSNALALPLESEGGNLGSSIDRPVNQRPDNLHGDFRGPYKRKLSPVDLADASPFDPQFTARSESARTGGFGNNQDPNGFANFHPVSNPSMIPVWGDPLNDSSEYVGNDSELPQSSRGVSSDRSPGLIGEETLRSLQTQPFSTPHEPIQSQSHSLFARNLRRTVQSHTFTRRTPDVLGGGAAGSTSMMPGIEHWPPLVGDRSPAPPMLSNWGPSSGSRRSNSAFSSPGSRERGSSNGAFEASRYRSMPGRTLDWAMAAAAAAAAAPAPMEHRLPSQMIANGAFAVPTGREMDPPDSSARISQAANSFFNSGVLASYFPASGSGAPRANRNAPPLPSVSTAPSHQLPVGSPMEAPPPLAGQHASRYASPSPSRVRREALLTAPVQSVLGLPFRGLHTLRADGEYRRQFLSEILNAMHHAFRSEDLNIEELVMLDPSIIYGGGDAHDQHRDMRLDVDNMTYEELLALEERIGNVNTGLDEQRISLCLRESKYSSLDATVAAISQESDVKCSICQEEFVEEDELGRLDCGHGYHSVCIKQWLLQKNECPICKSSAYIKP